MKKQTVFAIFATLLFSAAAVCAQPAAATRTIQGATGYKSVTVKSSMDIVFDDIYTDSIYIEAPAELMEKLSLEYKGTSVTASYKKASKRLISDSPRAVLHLSSRWLESLSVSGDSNITAAQQITGKKLSISLDGDCSMTADLNAATVNVSLQHGAQLHCSLVCTQLTVSEKSGSIFEATAGRCGKLTLTASGDSSFDGARLEDVKGLKVTMSGNTKADVKSAGDAVVSLNDNALMTGSLQCNKLALTMSKSSNAFLSGMCKTLTLKTNDKCYFRNSDFETQASATCQIAGNSNAEIDCRGNVNVKATDAANVYVVRCGGKLKIDARGTSSVTYPQGTRMDSILIKDQAATKFLPANGTEETSR